MAEDLGKEALELLVLLVPAEASANERIGPFKTPVCLSSIHVCD